MDQSVQRSHPPICRAVPVGQRPNECSRRYQNVRSRTWSRLSPIWRVRICAYFSAGSIRGHSQVTSASISPGQGTDSGSCSVPVDSPESVLLPAEQHTLPGLGIGITNLVGRVTAAASELSVAELRDGARSSRPRPGCCGHAASQYSGCRRTGRRFSDRRLQSVARQPELLGGALLWLLPNPSGLQARYQLPQMEEMLRKPSSLPRRQPDG